MKVTVKWLKSPRQVYGIPRAPGTFSQLDVKLAKKIQEESPGMFESLELDKPGSEKPKPRKAQTRPVYREEKS
ncbi:hypothetical protein LCGC14_1576030 [marine sediment metagenome]|uniref:Uncharacterized protein n=1 Tax=marine sediment metagenome TaxID=412755 RepID=A0A0F9J4E9_9ZZZZ